MVVSTWRAVTYIIQPLRPVALKPARRPPGRARAFRGVLLAPKLTCLSLHPPPALWGLGFGEVVRSGEKKKNIRIDRVVPYVLQSTVKKLESQGQREAEGTFSGRTARGGGTREWNVRNLHPSFFGSVLADLSQSPKYKGRLGPQLRGSGVGRGCEGEGTPLHAGAQWAKLRQASGHRYTPELLQVSKHCFSPAGSPFRACSRCCLHGPSHLPQGAVPPRVAVCLRP